MRLVISPVSFDLNNAHWLDLILGNYYKIPALKLLGRSQELPAEGHCGISQGEVVNPSRSSPSVKRLQLAKLIIIDLLPPDITNILSITVAEPAQLYFCG